MKLLFVFLLASALSLAGPINGPTNVTLVNAGDGVNDGSYYVGPYTLAIDGKNYAVMCIDFLNDSTVGTSWMANFTSLNSTDFSETYLGAGGNTAKLYDEEAYLDSMLMGTKDPTQRIDIQHAAWYVTDNSYGLNAGASNELDIALANYNSSSFQSTLGNYEIVSGVRTGSGREQEFIVGVAIPEPRSLAMIGAGLLVITGLLRRVALKKIK